MNIMFELAGSIVVGALIMLMILGFRTNVASTADSQYFNQAVQENLRALTEVLENDFRKIGYGVSNPTKITTADSTNIVFQGDVDTTAASPGLETMRYYLGDTKPSNIHNPRIRTFFRVKNGASVKNNAGLTNFRLRYYDASGNQLATPVAGGSLRNIRSIKIALSVESPSPVDSTSSAANGYSGVYWERTFRPQNLR